MRTGLPVQRVGDLVPAQVASLGRVEVVSKDQARARDHERDFGSAASKVGAAKTIVAILPVFV